MSTSMHETTVDLGPLENTRVRFEYTPSRPGCMYLSNGDPGYPDEPEELYITEVLIGDKWIGASVFEGVGWLEKAEATISETRIDELAAHAEADAQDAWERQQERRMEEGYP